MANRTSKHLIGMALIAVALGAASAVSSPAWAQSKTGYTPPTTTYTPPVTTYTPPTTPSVPVQPKLDFTRLYIPPPTSTVPEIPDGSRTRPEGDRRAKEDSSTRTGEPTVRGDLTKLQSVSSIGQLMVLPAPTETSPPSAVLHRLENRLPVPGQAAGNEAPAMEGRADALKALESAKSIL